MVGRAGGLGDSQQFAMVNAAAGHLCSPAAGTSSSSSSLAPMELAAAALPYDLHEVICRNATSVLWRATGRANLQSLAVQVVDLNRRCRRPGFSIEDLKREVQVLRSLQPHTHIVQLIDAMQRDRFFCIAFEYLQGRDLCSEIVDRAAAGFVFSEFVVSHYVRQLLSAIGFCHDRDIIHRDVRPDCALLASQDNSAPLKLTGFHLAVQLPDSNAKVQGTNVGCIGWMAPEIVHGQPYNCAVDMWSVGVLVFVLLSGCYPFAAGHYEDVFNLIANGQYQMIGRAWDPISDYAKDFVIKLLTVDHQRRLTAAEALRHPWIQDKEHSAQRTHLAHTVCLMQRFNVHRRLKNRIVCSVNSDKWVRDVADDDERLDIVEPQYLAHGQSASTEAVRRIYLSLDETVKVCQASEMGLVSPLFNGAQPSSSTTLNDMFELLDHVHLASLRFSAVPATDAQRRLQAALEHLDSVDHLDQPTELRLILNSPDIKVLFQIVDVLAADVFPKDVCLSDSQRLEQQQQNHSPSSQLCLNDAVNNVVDNLTCSSSDLSLSPISRVRIVQFQRNTDEPMGITMKLDEDGKCIIARIMHGGMVHRQGTLHVGDEVREINGISTTNGSVENLQRLLRDLRGTVTFKVVPSYRSAPPPCEVYVRCQFDYDPTGDDLIPCPQAGIQFRTGDILQVISKDDYNWWQARHVTSFPAFGWANYGPASSVAGLIPSPELQEWRTACLAMEHAKSPFPCMSIGKSKRHQLRKHFLKSRSIADRLDLATYEEVVRMPAFRRKTLVLLGANGVGRRHVKNTIIQRHPDRYAYPIPHTTRPPRRDEVDGQHYYFVSHEAMLNDVQKNEYLEYGTHEDHMYGTKLDTIRQIHRAGKIAILDVEPQAMKLLRTAEYSPFIVFIAAPDLVGIADPDGSLERLVRESEMLRQAYGHFFDYIIVNNDIDDTIRQIELITEKLHLSPQWVPVCWVY